MRILFSSCEEWQACAKSGVCELLHAMLLLARSVFGGLASMGLAAWRYVAGTVGRYPSIALGTFLVCAMAVWFFTFVSMRERAVRAEDQRDSVRYEYINFKRQHGFEDYR